MPNRLTALALVLAAAASGAGVAPAQAATTATVSSSAMATWQTNGRVNEVTYSSSAVYLVGEFTAVRAPGGSTWVTRRRAAAFRVSDGGLLPWNPDANASIETVTISPDRKHVYLDGDFTRVRGVARSHLAKVGAKYGVLSSSWQAATNGTVRTLKASGYRGYLHVGGSFSTVNGTLRKRIGAVRLGTGSLVKQFSAGVADPKYATVAGIVLTRAGLWVGGHFERIRGHDRKNLALIRPATGRLRSPKPSARIPILRTVAANGRLCVTGRGPGGFAACYGVSSGQKLWGGKRKADGDVQAATMTGGVLYVGGHFGVIRTPSGERSRQRLAAFAPGTGELFDWNPGANSLVGVLALGRSGDGSHVAAGGAFTRIGGRAQDHFAQFSK